MELFELIESMDAARASVHTLFGNEGTSLRESGGSRNPRFQEKLVECVKFVKQVFQGTRPMWQLKEALSTSDFPLLFGTTLDRMMLANFRAYPSNWDRIAKRSTVRDFRNVDRFRTSDGDQRLQPVGQGESYPQGEVDEQKYSYRVNKYGRRFDMLWEALVNDDLDALRDIPNKMATASARTRQHFVASLYVANATLYSTTHAVSGINYSNKGTADLALTALEAAVTEMMKYPADANSDGTVEPIFNIPVILRVPPALKITAEKVVGQVNYIDSTETNVLRGALGIEVDPYIPIVDPTNGHNSWYLFADVDAGHAVEVGFLAGHEEPQMFMKAPNAIRLGGGDADPLGGDFDTDSAGYKVRDVIGGSQANAVGGWRFTWMSDGTA